MRMGSRAHRSRTARLPLSGKGELSPQKGTLTQGSVECLGVSLGTPSTGSWGCVEGKGEEGGQHLTSFEKQFGEGGGTQASSQVQGGVPSKSAAVDICSQLWKKA